MAFLPNNTFTNPQVSFYADAGGGGGDGSTLQSPASIVPDATGNTSLTLDATGTGNSQIDLKAVGANANASVFIESDQAIASLGLLGGSAFGCAINMTGITPGGNTTVIQQSGAAPYTFTMAAAPAQVGQTPFLTYEASSGTVTLGDSLSTGAVVTNNKLLVQSAPSNGNAVVIQSTGVVPIGNISTTLSDTGLLTLGSSVAQQSIVSISDNGAGLTQTRFVGNGDAGVVVTGGVSSVVPAAIYADNGVNTTSLQIGTVTNKNILTVQDLPNPNATVTGDIVVTGTAVVGGSLTADDIVLTGASSTIQVPGQGTDSQPVGITMTPTQTLLGSPKLIQSIPNSVYNGGLDGQTSFNYNINSTGQPNGVIGNTGAQVGGPGALGDQSYEGLWVVSLVCPNASTDIYSKLAQIRTVSYWNPATGWFGGSGGACTLGGAEFRAGINPSNVIAAGQLWVTNTSGNNWTGMSVNITQITGVIPGYFVA